MASGRVVFAQGHETDSPATDPLEALMTDRRRIRILKDAIRKVMDCHLKFLNKEVLPQHMRTLHWKRDVNSWPGEVYRELATALELTKLR